MKLRSISLTNVRKFGGRTASLSDIGDGITVVSEANEFGKSTFFDALHALFFEKFGATGRSIKSLQPRSGGGVRVAAQVETEEGIFQIEKRWLAQKGATVRDVNRGTLVASDGEAEAWISALTGERSDGPTGLLWVRQGMVGLEPDAKSERENLAETRRDLLSSVAGEIDTMTGGRKMDRVMRRCLADLAGLTTATGRPSGAWKTAQERVKELSQEHATLEAQCTTLSQALKERRAIDDELSKLDTPEARAKRETDIENARKEMRVAGEHAAKTKAAEQAKRIAALEHDSAEKLLANNIEAKDALIQAQKDSSRAEQEDADAQKAVAQTETDAQTARDAYQRQHEVVGVLRGRLEACRKNAAAHAAAVRAEKLKDTLKKAEIHRQAQIDAQTAINANPVTPERLEKAEKCEREVARLEASRTARAATVTLSYETDSRVSLEGHVLEPNEEFELPKEARLGLPGIGSMLVRTAVNGEVDDIESELASAIAKRANVFAECDAEEIVKVRESARSRAASETAAELAVGLLAAVAPEGIEALLQHEADARALAVTTDEDNLDDPDEILALISSEQEEEQEARRALENAEAKHANAREKAAGVHARHLAAKSAVSVAEGQLGPVGERDAIRAQLTRDVVVAEEKLTVACNALEVLLKNAPDLVTAEANLKRVEDAASSAIKRKSDLAERRSGLSATIETQADRGIEERRDEIAGELENAIELEGRLSREVASLQCLRDVLEEARSAAREAYFGPIQEELAPLLRILHDDAALSFNTDTMLPDALSRGTEAEELETLSGGTKEQIAILTRLAFASLFAKQGRHMPIILDDALVYSDDARIVQMFTALNRVAANQQILVFSCRQLAFADLGGTRPTIKLTEAQ